MSMNKFLQLQDKKKKFHYDYERKLALTFTKHGVNTDLENGEHFEFVSFEEPVFPALVLGFF